MSPHTEYSEQPNQNSHKEVKRGVDRRMARWIDRDGRMTNTYIDQEINAAVQKTPVVSGAGVPLSTHASDHQINTTS